MKYQSTRGGSVGSSFEDTLFSGYCEDGGLYVPQEIPQISVETLALWKRQKLTYQQVVGKITRLFVSPEEIPDSFLDQAINEAYGKFKVPEVIKVAHLKDKIEVNKVKVKVAELYHGPTASFKDLALSLVNKLLSYFMEKRKEHCTILVGTSGDTGSAAIESVKGLKNVDIIVLYPKGMVSKIQELQMTSSIGEKNIHVFAVEGTSDDLDVPIRESLPCKGLTSVNSINWARILVQISHYTYLYLISEDQKNLNIITPTGAAGNIASGLIANLMGIPINLHCATNVNDSVHQFLSNGVIKFNGEISPTPANAMDIGYPYNIERILFLFFGSEKVCQFFPQGQGQLTASEIDIMRKTFKGSENVKTDQIYKTIRKCWEDFEYIICPHTATAMSYFYSNPLENAMVLSTADPKKFPESVLESGISNDIWDYAGLLKELEKNHGKPGEKVAKVMKKGQNWYQILQDEIKETKMNFSTQF